MENKVYKLTDETGMTLVEILAAITILSIIVTAFLAFFIQAGRTNNMTNDVNEATFLAQEEIERLTHLSTTDIKPVDISQSENGQVSHQIIKDDESGLYQVIVEVTEGGQVRAKMETRLPFAEEATDKQ